MAGDAETDAVRVVEGETFDVGLAATPTSGYAWELDQAAAGDLLEFLASEFIPSRAGIVGGDAMQVFTFKARRAGEAQLRFLYSRRWEPAPLRVKVVPLVIEARQEP